MSQARPAISDAAARAPQRFLGERAGRAVARTLPELHARTTGNVCHTASTGVRLPSRRPLDQRWDRSRGILLQQRQQGIVHDHTWSPHYGIIFAEPFSGVRRYAIKRPAPFHRNPPSRDPPSRDSPPTSIPPAAPLAPGLDDQTYTNLGIQKSGQTSSGSSLKAQYDRELAECNQKREESDEMNKQLQAENRRLKNDNTQLSSNLKEAKVKINSFTPDAQQNSQLRYEAGVRDEEKRSESIARKLRAELQTEKDAIEALQKDAEKLRNSMKEAKFNHLREMKEEKARHEREKEEAKRDLRSRKQMQGNYRLWRTLFEEAHDSRSVSKNAAIDTKKKIALPGEVEKRWQDSLRRFQNFCASTKIPQKLQENIELYLEAELKKHRDLMASVDRYEQEHLREFDALSTQGHDTRLFTRVLRGQATDDQESTLPELLFRYVVQRPLKYVHDIAFGSTIELNKKLKDSNDPATQAILRKKKDLAEVAVAFTQSLNALINLDREHERLKEISASSLEKKVRWHISKDARNELVQMTSNFRMLTKETNKLTKEFKIKDQRDWEFSKASQRSIRDDFQAVRETLRTLGELAQKKVALARRLGTADELEAEQDRLLRTSIRANELKITRKAEEWGVSLSVRQRNKPFARQTASRSVLSKPTRVARPSPRENRKTLSGPRQNEGEPNFRPIGVAESVGGQVREKIAPRRRLRVAVKERKAIPDQSTTQAQEKSREIQNIKSEIDMNGKPRTSSLNMKPTASMQSWRLPFLYPSRALHEQRPLIMAARIDEIPSNLPEPFLVGAMDFTQGAVAVELTNDNGDASDDEELVDWANGNNSVIEDHQFQSTTPARVHDSEPDGTQAVKRAGKSDVTPDSLEEDKAAQGSDKIAQGSGEAESSLSALTYQMSPDDYRSAAMASRTTAAAFWSYNLYKGKDGLPPKLHYVTKYEQAEAELPRFLNEPVLGFDLEWEQGSVIGKSSPKRCVSLIQIAAEDRIMLIHTALFKGERPEDLMPPSLRRLLENPSIIKAGVHIGGDAGRVKSCLGVEMRGTFELSHLYKVVTFSEKEPQKVNKKSHSLAEQVHDVLLLPLSKGEVRTSAWSQKLVRNQFAYAASDAYAGFRLFHALETKRLAMRPTPPRPALWELKQPLVLGDGKVMLPRPRAPKRATGKTPEEDEEELEFFDAVETQEEEEDLDVDKISAEEPAPVSERITYPVLSTTEEVEGLLGEDPERHITDTAITEGSLEEKPERHTIDKAITEKNITPKTIAASASPAPELVMADEWITAYRASSSEPSGKPAVGNSPLRAYYLWQQKGMDLKKIGETMRQPQPLASTTVASYILETIRKEDLPYDVVRIWEPLSEMPNSVKGKYRAIWDKARES